MHKPDRYRRLAAEYASTAQRVTLPLMADGYRRLSEGYARLAEGYETLTEAHRSVGKSPSGDLQPDSSSAERV